ncbi:MAG: ATP-binding protein [Elusimicrobiota bacterium]|nr:ATP-binding protein [Elusimicrobiota bacterium]
MIEDSALVLAREILAAPIGGARIETKLTTDQQVLARVTDGIYRQPASAIRELITNAYDADATSVVIQTDSPRFNQIRIRDDGNGFTTESLASLVHHIGGSPKRSIDGVALGVTQKEDPSRSPGGRKLIGKSGIGLFAVSQLTRHFQIITKTKGQDFRMVADVILHTHSEDEVRKERPRAEYETGDVEIWRVPAIDIESHGTDIVLLDLLPKIKENLRSEEEWARAEFIRREDPERAVTLPNFHIGRIDVKNPETILIAPRVPWAQQDSSPVRFRKLVDAVVSEAESTERNPTLEKSLDNYLRMIWTLSLSAPLEYIDGHPFDTAQDGTARVYRLSNERGGQAEEVVLKTGEKIRDKISLTSPSDTGRSKFTVFIDDVQLSRPLRIRPVTEVENPLGGPLIFVGSYTPDLSKFAKELRGGSLSFEAYILWTPKIVPKDHIGSLIRIHEASGALFDETFMKYQVAELTRLKQISVEIFVHEGMDAALNIDRESFNFAHPHYQIVAEWLHQAIRQFTNRHKALLKEVRKEQKTAAVLAGAASLNNIIAKAAFSAKNLNVSDGEYSPVKFVKEFNGAAVKEQKAGAVVFNIGSEKQFDRILPQLEAMIKILDAFGLLEGLSYKQQQHLLGSVADVLLYMKSE